MLRNRLLEVGEFFAGQQANRPQRRQMLFGACHVADHKIGLADVLVGPAVTRLDHLASHGHSSWRLPMINQQPWIADASHAAMHQPAGPEVVPATKLA